MNQLEYIPGIGGASIQLDGPVAFVGTAENLRGREWNFDLGYRDLVSANRPARTVDITLWTDPDTANALRRVADADVMAKTPGTLIAQGEWKQSCYILEAKPAAIHYDALQIELKVALLDGAWWRMVEKEFLPEETPVTEYGSDTGEIVNVAGAVETPLHGLTVYGKSVQNGTPTPNAPVRIDSLCAPNIFDADVTPSGTTRANVSHSVGTLTVTATSTAQISYAYYDIPVTKLGEVSFSCKASTNTSYVRLAARDASSNLQTWDMKDATELLAVNKTLPSGTTTIRLLFYVNSTTSAIVSGDSVTYSDIQLEYGSQATTYLPYQCISIDVDGSITFVNLGGYEITSSPNGICDELVIDSSGNVSIKRYVKTLNVATGDWSLRSDNRYRISLSDSAANSVGLDIFSDSYAVELSAADMPADSIGIVTAGNYAFLGASSSLVDSVLMYPLATYQTISLGSITMPNVEDGSYVKVIANMTPTITAEWALTSEFFLDYPHNYEYDYSEIAAADSIESSVYTPSDVRLVIFGPATNPYILVGGNKYQVNVTVPSGGYVTVDGREKTIVLTLADGTTQNAFSYGVRGGGQGGGTYVFEPIKAGAQEVTYSGAFGFNLGWYEEEGEPPWKSY